MAKKRVFGPALLAGAAAVLYTVPAGFMFLIRHIHISNPSAGAVDATLSIGADAAGTRIFDGRPMPADDVYDWFGYLPMVAGEDIRGWASAAATLNCEISGDLEAI